MVFIKNNKLVVLGYVSFFAYELSIPNKFQMCGKYGIHYFYWIFPLNFDESFELFHPLLKINGNLTRLKWPL